MTHNAYTLPHIPPTNHNNFSPLHFPPIPPTIKLINKGVYMDKTTNKSTDHDKEAAHKAHQKEVESGKGMAILAYIIALIPYFAEKKNKFVRYHAIQGMNIFLVALAYGILAGIINGITWNAAMGNCVNSIFSASYANCNFGLVNAAQGKMKPVPILGKVKIIKK